jgi:transmembrane sensor
MSDHQQLFNRYFRGTLHDKEYEKLLDLLAEPGMREFFEQEKLRWAQNPEQSDLGKHNYQQIANRIARLEKISEKKKVSRLIWMVSGAVAAALIIGLLIGHYLNSSSTNNTFNGNLAFEAPRGEKSILTLPDGTEVWLNANSRLICHQFSKTERKVELTGEAYFHVSKHPQSIFHVQTAHCTVEVKGTKFNVMAYPKLNRDEVTLLEGSVAVAIGGTKTLIDPGQMLVVQDHQLTKKTVETASMIAWVSNKFDFKDIPLSELIMRLENWYDVDIKLINKTGKEVNFSGTFKNEETIWQVLDAIKVYIPIAYKKTNLREITVTLN